MIKKIIGIICVATMMVSMLGFSSIVTAEEIAPKGKVVVTIDEESDLVSVEVAVKETNFVVLQSTFRYNTEVLKPVNAEGNETDKFNEFATLSEKAEFFNSIGKALDVEKGIFEFTLFVMPGTEDEFVNENGECVPGEDGIVLYNFEFKRIAEGEHGIELALKDDTKPYREVIPEAIGFGDSSGVKEVEVTFIDNGIEEEKVSVTPPSPKPVTPKPEVPKEMTSKERKEDVICLKMGASMTITHGVKKLIDDGNSQVVPYINNDRTMVPVRFISEALDAEVLWEDGWDGCIIKKGDKVIELTFGSAEFTVNGEKFTYDAPMEMLHDRTMVPVRFVSEHLDCDVYWEPINNAVLISPIDNPWVPDRKAEIDAVNEMLLSILNIL